MKRAAAGPALESTGLHHRQEFSRIASTRRSSLPPPMCAVWRAGGMVVETKMYALDPQAKSGCIKKSKTSTCGKAQTSDSKRSNHKSMCSVEQNLQRMLSREKAHLKHRSQKSPKRTCLMKISAGKRRRECLPKAIGSLKTLSTPCNGDSQSECFSLLLT